MVHFNIFIIFFMLFYYQWNFNIGCYNNPLHTHETVTSLPKYTIMPARCLVLPFQKHSKLKQITGKYIKINNKITWNWWWSYNKIDMCWYRAVCIHLPWPTKSCPLDSVFQVEEDLYIQPCINTYLYKIIIINHNNNSIYKCGRIQTHLHTSQNVETMCTQPRMLKWQGFLLSIQTGNEKCTSSHW